MLTALGEINDKMDAFNLGADDYIVKPFHFNELFARIKVFLKRAESGAEQTEKINISNLEIDLLNKSVTRGDTIIILPLKSLRYWRY
jgi:DNA-binding response OmpR family regulator